MLIYRPLILWAGLFLSIPGLAQQGTKSLNAPIPPPSQATSNGPFRDPQALTVVQKALDALGGISAISQAQSWRIVGQAQGSKGTSTATVTWEVSGREWRMAATVGKTTFYELTGHGNPAWVMGNGTARKIPSHVMRAEFVPALVGPLLLTEFQNPGYSFSYAGGINQSVNQTAVPSGGTSPQLTVVRIGIFSRDPKDRVTTQTWYFDPASGLPVRVEFRVPSQTRTELWIAGAVTLSQYQASSGAKYPFQITRYLHNSLIDSVTLHSVTVNSTISENDFDSPVTPQ